MGLAAFLAALGDDGRAPVPDALGAGGDEDVDAALAALDGAARRDAPGDAPPLDLPAARWAARALYAGAQALALRGAEAGAVAAALDPAPPAPTPSAAWSVDLVLAALPDLARLARGLPGDDPLTGALARWARAWPLSSVGLPLAAPPEPAALEAVVGHPALRVLYVDRALARRDLARLAEPRVADAARAALGLFPAACPEVAGALGVGAPAAAPAEAVTR